MKSLFNKKGFTLIELIVGVSIFTAVALAAIGTLSIARDGARRTQIIRTVLDNVNFAVESMSRKIRVGTKYHCGTTGTLSDPRDCSSSPESSMTFTVDRGALGCISRYTYALGNHPDGKGKITVKEEITDAYGCTSTVGFALPQDLTSPDVDIDLLRFYVRDALSGDFKQPSVTMVVRGVARTPKGEATTFSLETYATQRKLDQ